ncbi:hypothetical protein ACVWYG_003380 [Pedobacter sp. UYEF25]
MEYNREIVYTYKINIWHTPGKKILNLVLFNIAIKNAIFKMTICVN